MIFQRQYDKLDTFLEPNKVLLIYGPRQVGKTTLLERYLKGTSLQYRFETGDNIKIRSILGSQDLDQIKAFAEGYPLIVIDEAQRIPHIGLGLKMLVDHVEGIHIIATGSSSFALAGEVGEPLTGRKNTLMLYPLSQMELARQINKQQLEANLETYLVFGGYPEVLTTNTREKKIQRLEEIAHSYLLKDILEMEQVKGSKVLLDLLRLIAFQVGNEVSLSELGKHIGIDYKTIGRYLDLFEKAFIIFNVRGYSRNLRKEITKKSKYYFFDNGIRNALIANFNELELRNDIGGLWENFVFMERLKKRSYAHIPANVYFWRTWGGQEVDIVEEREGRLFGYECKWGNKKISAPAIWTEAYPNASYDVISPSNYMALVT